MKKIDIRTISLESNFMLKSPFINVYRKYLMAKKYKIQVIRYPCIIHLYSSGKSYFDPFLVINPFIRPETFLVSGVGDRTEYQTDQYFILAKTNFKNFFKF